MNAFTGGLAGAVQFLTRCPLPPRWRSSGFGPWAFPIVGAALGLAAIVVDEGLSATLRPARDIGIVAFWALATGALHYDGLADTLDALGGRDREDSLRVMKDSSIGTFGVLGVIFVVVAKLSALSGLESTRRAEALLLAPALGRWAMLMTALRATAARPEGLGARFVAALEGREVAIASALVVACAVAFGGEHGIAALLASLALAVAVRWTATRRFGGVTGDVIGACGELVETMALVVFAAGHGG